MRFFLLLSAISTLLFVGCTADSSSSGSGAMQGWQTTSSGLKYRILEEGPGAKPAAEDTVRVHYRGWLPDESDPDSGPEFDSSYGGEPVSFPLNQVIPGWTEGLQLVGAGGKIELEIPSELGYGEMGSQGVIPPNATLRFVVELLGPPAPGPVDADAPTEFTTTDSGLKYRVLRKGNGRQPRATDTVTVHYRGWLPDAADPSTGKEFDSSYARAEKTSFPLNRVIPGWTEGLQLVSENGMIELDIPSELAYGGQAKGDDIPANSDLRFIVELFKIHPIDGGF